VKRTRPNHLLTVGAGVLFVAAVLVGLMFFGGFWYLGKSYDVTVFVPNARGLADDASVMIAGLEVGKVTSIERNGPDAIVGLRIDDVAPTPLPEDSTVAVRLRSLVGESYVQVYPGHSKITVRSGGSLDLGQSDDYTDVDQILQTLSGTTETHARQTVQALGDAVGVEGDHLNHVLGNAAALISRSVPLTSTLAAQHTQVADLVQNLGNMMNAIGQRTTAVQDFASGAVQTFDALSSRDVQLRDTLVKLPYAIGSLKDVANTIAVITPHVAPLAINLASAIDEVSPAIHLLAPASNSGVQLLQALGAAADPLRDVLQNLDTLQKPTTAALPELHATLCQVNPILKYAAPYAADFGAFFQNFGSAYNAYDASGHVARASADVTPAAAGGVVTPTEAADVATLEKLGFGKEQIAGYDPFPPPDGATNTTIGRGLTGPVDAGKVMTYTRVHAGDC
jgi:phospholipid/cholesterol/gamma-HCH transport system substrate-binding protein